MSLHLPGVLRIGTRGSALSRAQAGLVAQALRDLSPDLKVTLVTIVTGGDRSTRPVDGETFKGLFTKEIEEALLRGEIDAAVHSLKDLPVADTPGLRLAAVPPRADPRDALVTSDGRRLDALPAGARVGTSSARRDVLIRDARPDLAVEPIRGNVDTRLRRLDEGRVDALVLAAAGLIRLGREAVIAERFAPETFVPAPGQGALAVQVREDDHHTAQIVSRLDDRATRVAVQAERRFTEAVGGDCRLPVGAYAVAADHALRLVGMVFTTRPVRVVVEGRDDPDETARRAAAAILTARAGDR